MRIPYRGAGCVFIKKENNEYFVFLGERSKRPFLSFLAVPGGGFDKIKDKSDFDCAVRECNEETNINPLFLIKNNKAKLLGEKQIKFFLFSWRSFFFYVKDSEDFNNAVPDEFSYLKWYKIKDLMPLKLRPFTLFEIKNCLKLSEFI